MVRSTWRLSGIAAVMFGICFASLPASAQQTTGTETPAPDDPNAPIDDSQSELTKQLTRTLTDADAAEKAKRERERPPIEIFKSSILPNDILPYTKANHWLTLGLELRANHNNFNGTFETQPISLLDMPHEVIYRRDAGLVRGQRSRLLIQLMTPVVAKELRLKLERPESIIPDEYLASMRVLEPHQMLIPVLTKGTNDSYSRWQQLPFMFPLSGQKSDAMVYDRQRYYRMVLPSDIEHPQLPGHPLTWTTISHVIWDGIAPETLSPSQQDAMLDWLHWGGQLIIVGGAAPTLAPLRESFLAPYLPAEINGQSAQLTTQDLDAFSKIYPPPSPTFEPDEPIEGTQRYETAFETYGKRYGTPVPIFLPANKPLYVASLTPKPNARVIDFGKPNLPPLAVEWRIGRGRVMMLGIGLNDPGISSWPGFSTMVRRVVLRRPEDPLGEELRYNNMGGGGYLAPRYDSLVGPDLTWTRIFGRDLGAPERRVDLSDDDPQSVPQAQPSTKKALPTTPPAIGWNRNQQPSIAPFQIPVAEWLDNAALPRMSREKLEQASGIEIPGARFVLIVILAYIIALVPINLLICRLAFGRREWAWLAAPVLALIFAVIVERAAAYDVGYDSACNEVDLIEMFGDYPRGHINRFASLYTTGRVKYTIAYPNDPTALVLPLNTGRSIRGEDVAQSVFQATPTPQLSNFQVQPRSLAMFRAEQLVNLPGTFALTEENGVRKVVNNSPYLLRDAVLIDLGLKESKITRLGRIETKGVVEVGQPMTEETFKRPTIEGLKKNQVDPGNFLELVVRASIASRPEDAGEVRLIGWVDSHQAGQAITPPVDVHQGFTVVVAHLKMGPPPDPALIRYNALARGAEMPSSRMLNTEPPPVYQRFMAPLPARGGATTPAPARRVPAGAIPLPPPPPVTPGQGGIGGIGGGMGAMPGAPAGSPAPITLPAPAPPQGTSPPPDATSPSGTEPQKDSSANDNDTETGRS